MIAVDEPWWEGIISQVACCYWPCHRGFVDQSVTDFFLCTSPWPPNPDKPDPTNWLQSPAHLILDFLTYLVDQ